MKNTLDVYMLLQVRSQEMSMKKMTKGMVRKMNELQILNIDGVECY